MEIFNEYSNRIEGVIETALKKKVPVCIYLTISMTATNAAFISVGNHNEASGTNS